MKVFSLAVLSVSLLAGCAGGPPASPDWLRAISDFAVSASSDPESLSPDASDPLIKVRFDQVPFGSAMKVLSDLTNRSIIWDESIDSRPVAGFFNQVPMSLVLASLARRAGSTVVQLGPIFYVGQARPGDRAIAVVPIPPGGSPEQILKSVSGMMNEGGRATILGGALLLADTPDLLRRVVDNIELVRRALLRRYVAEIYVVKVRRSDLLALGAIAGITGDLFVGDLTFSAVLSHAYQRDRDSVITIPILQLSEGVIAELRSNREVRLPRQAVTDSGTIQQIDYSTISAGTVIKLLCRRASDQFLSVDLSLELSSFGDSTATGAPDKRSDEVVGQYLVRRGEGLMIASLSSYQSGRAWKLFGFQQMTEHDQVTIWLRVREISSAPPAPK